MSEVIDTIPDIDGDVIEVIFGCGMEELPVLRIGGALVILDDHAAERFTRAWNQALRRRDIVRPAPHRRPCCDHCNNAEGPGGHDYTLDGPHDGPCQECGRERARREHDAGTGD